MTANSFADFVKGPNGHIPDAGYGSLASSVTDMQVDYVRVYQSVPEPTALALVSGVSPFLLRRRRKR